MPVGGSFRRLLKSAMKAAARAMELQAQRSLNDCVKVVMRL